MTELPKYLVTTLLFSLVIATASRGSDSFLQNCGISGRDSAKAGNINCTKSPDLEDQKVDPECVNRYEIGCKLARIEFLCGEGIANFLRTEKCSPSKEVCNFGKDYYEVCCKMCARRKETFLKNGTCSKNDIPLAYRINKHIQTSFGNCCLDNANCISSTTDELRCDCLEGFTKNSTTGRCE